MTHGHVMRQCTMRNYLAFAIAGSAVIVALAFSQAAKAQQFGPGPSMGGNMGSSMVGPSNFIDDGQVMMGGPGGSQGGFGGPQMGGQGMMGPGGPGGQQGGQGMMGGKQGDPQQGGMMNQQNGQQGGFNGQRGGKQPGGMMNQGSQQGGSKMGGSKMGQGGQQQGGSKMGGKQPGGMMGPEGFGDNGQGMGPGGFGENGDEMDAKTEERMQKGEERQKQQEERMNAQRLKQMKQGMKGLTNGLKMMKQGVKKIQPMIAKCGLALPEELTKALESADTLVAKADSTQSADEFEEIMGEAQEIGMVMQEWGPRMGELPRMCQMFKQADLELKKLDKAVASAKSKATKSKIDISSLVTSFEETVNTLRAALTSAKENAKTAPDEAGETLKEGFFEALDDAWNAQRAIDTVLNLRKNLTQIDAQIKKLSAKVTSLSKRKATAEDAKELIAQLDEVKTQRAELNAVLSDPDAAPEAVQALFETLNELQNGVQALSGGQSDYYSAGQFKQQGGVNFQMPQGFGASQGGEGGF